MTDYCRSSHLDYNAYYEHFKIQSSKGGATYLYTNIGINPDKHGAPVRINRPERFFCLISE